MLWSWGSRQPIRDIGCVLRPGGAHATCAQDMRFVCCPKVRFSDAGAAGRSARRLFLFAVVRAYCRECLVLGASSFRCSRRAPRTRRITLGQSEAELSPIHGHVQYTSIHRLDSIDDWKYSQGQECVNCHLESDRGSCRATRPTSTSSHVSERSGPCRPVRRERVHVVNYHRTVSC